MFLAAPLPIVFKCSKAPSTGVVLAGVNQSTLARAADKIGALGVETLVVPTDVSDPVGDEVVASTTGGRACV
jgi:hypothetical protein